MGLVLNKYEVLRRLAVGGMGEVFLARQRAPAGMDRLVVLKTMLPEYARSEEFVRQFFDEARVAASLSHPNVVAIYEAGSWRGTAVIAMEFINGETVASMLHRFVLEGINPPLGLAAWIIRDAARALDYAHSAVGADGQALMVVHRDVSPDNIMVRKDGIVKVVDFGIATASHRETRTATGVVKGKFRYMAPEQLRGGVVTALSDQFSLGVVFWELLTQGRLFRRAAGEAEVLQFFEKRESVPPPSTQNGRVPEEFDAVVVRMMQVDARNRYPSCGMVAEVLENLISVHGVSFSQKSLAQFVDQNLGTDSLGGGLEALMNARTNSWTDTFGADHDLRNGYDKYGTRPHRPKARARKWARSRFFSGAMAFSAVLSVFVAGTVLFSQRPKSGAPVGVQDAVSVSSALHVDGTTDGESVAPSSQGHSDLGALILSSDPPGAVVYVDGAIMGRTSTSVLSLEPLVSHKVVFKKAGYQIKLMPITLQASEERQVHAVLKRARRRRRGESASRSGMLHGGFGQVTVRTTPWTEVWLGGRLLGTTPLFQVKLPAGVHMFRFKNPKMGINMLKKVKVRTEKTTKLDIDLPRSR